MNNGVHYSTLERGDTVKINKYSYENGNKVSVILQSSQIDDIAFNNYKFNSDESLILLESETSKIYRYSKESIFHI